MEKIVKVSKDHKSVSVELKMDYSEFQDLRSYLNVTIKEKNFDFVNKCFDNVASKFHRCLNED